jgi:hypothetical protein
MANQLAIIEPIQLPDVRRPAKLSTLPQWLEARLTVLRREIQPDPATGQHREAPVLPRSLILGKEQKILVERHIAALDSIMGMTPEAGAEFAQATTTAVSKMTMVLAGKEAGELASEAKGEAFIDALEDVPSWAVQEAMRRWHRGECGPRHDYKWQPAPATLRELAMIEVYRVKGSATAAPRLKFCIHWRNSALMERRYGEQALTVRPIAR